MKLISLNLPDPRDFRMQGSGVSTFAAPSAEFVQALMGIPASAGKPVTRATAIRVAAFLSAVKMLCNDIAKMPLVLHETSVANGRSRRQPAIDNSLYPLLRYVPNRWQTSYELRWFQASQLITNGNAFCQKIYDQKGEISELVPLNAWSMRPKWDYNAPLVNERGVQITTIDGSGKKVPALAWEYMEGNSVLRTFYQPDIWHIKAHNLESIGVNGTSLLDLGKEAISLLIAAEETAGRNFANGLGMGGFISFPAESGITEDQAQNVVDRLKKDFSGSQNAGKFSVIPLGGKWEKMTFNAQESQLLDSRKWNEETVARMIGGAPLVVKLGLGQQNSTYASSSAFLDEYFNTSLLPYTTAIEQTISRDLIEPGDRAKLYAKHNADIILRGSPRERAETNQIKINSFQMTPNEAREQEDVDSVEGGDFLSGGTGTPVIFDIEKQEFFIPGQLPPASAGTAATPDAKPVDEPDTAGTNDDNDAQEPAASVAKPNKARMRLDVVANNLADRVMRKAAKAELDGKFVSEVLACSVNAANEYVAKYKDMTPDQQRSALAALVQGEGNE